MMRSDDDLLMMCNARGISVAPAMEMADDLANWRRFIVEGVSVVKSSIWIFGNHRSPIQEVCLADQPVCILDYIHD